MKKITNVIDVDNDYIEISDDSNDCIEMINDNKTSDFEIDNKRIVSNGKDIIKIDRKSELTLDFIMIVGKYYESNKDFINTMKINKMYQDLVSMYHFNPISDTILFEKIETQHFYNDDDLNQIKRGLFQYINWSSKYLTKETKIDKDNKLICKNEKNYSEIDGDFIFNNNDISKVINKKSIFKFSMSLVF